jgi:Ca2+:H+ antiporter
MLVAGFALLIPSAFYSALSGATTLGGEGEAGYTMEQLNSDTLGISHGVSIILIVAFVVYMVYNSASHDKWVLPSLPQILACS